MNTFPQKINDRKLHPDPKVKTVELQILLNAIKKTLIQRLNPAKNQRS